MRTTIEECAFGIRDEKGEHNCREISGGGKTRKREREKENGQRGEEYSSYHTVFKSTPVNSYI